MFSISDKDKLIKAVKDNDITAVEKRLVKTDVNIDCTDKVGFN